jgi:hypothetical protein
MAGNGSRLRSSESGKCKRGNRANGHAIADRRTHHRPLASTVAGTSTVLGDGDVLCAVGPAFYAIGMNEVITPQLDFDATKLTREPTAALCGYSR